MLKLNVCGDGYIEVGLTKNKNRKYYYVHRLVAIHFIVNNNPMATEVDHIDTNRINNIFTNLRWVTKSENNLNPITRKRLGHEKGKKLTELHKQKISNARKNKNN